MKGEAPKRCKIIIMDAPVATFPCSSRESSLASSQSSSRDQSLSRPSFDGLSLRSSSLDTSYYHRASSLNSSQTSSSLHASYSSLAPTTKSRNFNSSNGDLVSTPFSRSLSTKRLSLIKNNSSLIMTATDLPSTTDVLCKTSLARATRPMEELPMRNLKPLEQVKLIDREGQVKILRTRFEKLIGEDEFYHDHDTNDREKMDGESKISDNYFHDIDCGDSQQNESDHNDIEGKGHENENIALSEIEQKEHQQNQKSHHRLQTRQQRLRRLREKRLKSIKKKRRFHKLCHDISAPPDPTPLKRELVLVYGPYGCGKKALVKHALKDLVGGCHDCENGKVDCNANNGTDAGNGRNASGNGKNGWFITGTFEKNYFDKKANANGKGEIHSGNDHPRKRRAAIGTTVNVRFEDEGASLCSDLNDPLGSVSTPFSGILSACRHICTELLILRSSEETIEASDRNTNGHSNAEESNTIEQESGESPAEGKGGGVRWDMSHLFEETREELKQALNIEDCQVLVSQGLRDLATILDLSLDINGDIAIDKDATNVADNDDSFQLVRSGSNGSRRESNIIRRASNNRNSNLSTTSLDLDGAQKQLHIAFQKFFRVISQLHGPLVVVLDALQFADTSSLDLFEALLMDREIADLMVVGCVRTEDVPEDRRRSNDSRNSPTSHVSSRQKKCANEKLIVRIGKWKKKAETCGLSITEVAVGNLDLKGTDEFITNLMSLEDVDDSLPLSEVCHQRTRGNPLFLYKFLHLLWREKLIEFNMGCHRWEWDLENIASRTVVTHNALELLLRDFSHLSKEVRSVLVLSSCLGSCFSERCLFLVWDKMGVNSYLHQGDRTKIRQILAKAEEKQFIERVTDGTYKLRAGRHYRWTHDRIMDLAISNVPDDALCALRFEVGSTLFNALNEVELEEVIFTVANLVNSGGRSVLGSLEGSRRLQLARLNLLAARRAVELSAFNSAARYANAGVELLPNRRRWKDPSKELMLELSSISAEVAGSLSRRRDLERWCEEILCRNELTIHDKLRAYICLIDSMGKNECPDQAVDLCRVVLENLDCVFTKNQVGRDEEAMSERLEAIAKITHDDEYMQLVIDLPLMDDREKLQSMTILTRLCGYFMILQDKQSFAMIVSRMARWTFHYGLSLESPVVFAYYAISFIIRGDFAAGALNGWIALSLLEKFSNRKAKARTIFLVWYYVLPWSRHIRDSERPLIAGYHFATDCGDTRMSFFCIFGKIIADLISGRPLRQIDDVCRAFVPQIAQSELVGTLMRILWQTVLNLIGQCEDVNKLVGEGWNEEELALEESPHSSYVKNHFKAFKSYLYLFNGEHELSVDLAMERQDQFLEDIPGSALGLIDLISRGMPLFDAAQRTKKKRYINASNKIRKTCKTWLQNGNGVGSVVHHGMLFDAEKAILEGKVEDAKDLYKRGIAFASRAGFVQDAALLHERYATFLLSRKINSEEARYHLERAIIFYQEWGAQSRVQFIKQRVSAQL